MVMMMTMLKSNLNEMNDERISQKIVLVSSFLNVGNKFNALFSEIKYRHVGFL